MLHEPRRPATARERPRELGAERAKTQHELVFEAQGVAGIDDIAAEHVSAAEHARPVQPCFGKGREAVEDERRVPPTFPAEPLAKKEIPPV